MTIVELYADGGVALASRSLCGSWAYIGVDDRHVTAIERSGLLLPEHLGTRTVSNNDAEMYAVLRALEEMPDGWSGTVYTDSQCTIMRYGRIARCQSPTKTMHPELTDRAEWALDRLGTVAFAHLKGHPKKADLERGYNDKGQRVSPYQVRCDALCSEALQAYQDFTERRTT